MNMELLKYSSFKRAGATKAVCGPGGLNCPCCRTGTKAESKRLNARALRRAAKIAVRLNENV